MTKASQWIPERVMKICSNKNCNAKFTLSTKNDRCSFCGSTIKPIQTGYRFIKEEG
jgi:rRNA maturation endonuclease Nob1